MTEEKKRCAETGLEIGPGTRHDAYKHTVSVFHLPDLGREQLLKLYKGQTTEAAKRIVKNLS